jgi:biopolymer transport protein ExbD
MKLRPRRIALQLTPLVDILLVILFLQYVDSRQQQEATLAAATDAHKERDRAAAQLVLTESREQETRNELASARDFISRLNAESRAREERAVEAESALERADAQQRVLGELLVELFQLPADQVAAVLDPARDPPLAASPADVERLRKRFREFAESSPGAMIRHLLTYEEIRKRLDLWDLFIDAEGIATLKTGTSEVRFRVQPETFEEDLFRKYKSLPQSKDLVILLLSVDRRSERQFVQPVRAALPRVVDRMRADAGGRTRFEYADLGVRLE